MTDLFGEIITTPECAASILRKSTINAAQGFPEFWSAWPKGPRKVAKQACLDRWARLECARSAETILAHLEWMKNQDDWLRDSGRFIPMPNTYLGRQGWIDWIPPAPLAPRVDELARIKAHKGCAPSQTIRQRIASILMGKT